MNPHILRLLAEGHNQKQRDEVRMANSLFHLQGQYFAHAISSTVGNMFKKKGSKPNEYTKKPFKLDNGGELSEHELQQQRELFVAGLLAMQTNFELNHKDSAGS